MKSRQEYFYKIEDNLDVKRASEFIFLNRTCFYGLYRVNKNGEFNVPCGKYKNPTICDAKNLRNLSKLLQNVVFEYGDYRKCIKYIDTNTFVYFAPPYRPLSTASGFTSYTKEDFNMDNIYNINDMKKNLELIFPLIVTTVIAVVFKVLAKGDTIVINAIEFILENLFSLVTTLIGFIITTITIFVSFVKSKVMRYLKLNNQINRLLFFFVEPIIWGILVIIDIGYLATKFNDLNMMYTNQILIGIILFCLFIFCILRIALILCKLLFIVIEQPDSIEENTTKKYKVK